MATYTIQVILTVAHLTRTALASPWVSALAAAQCVLLLFRLQYFSRVFKSTRFAFIEAVRDVVSETRWVFAAVMVILTGFAAAFHILFRRDQGTKVRRKKDQGE